MAFRFESANERWSWYKRSGWQSCDGPNCKECSTYQSQLDRYDKLMQMGKPQAAEYWKQTILKDVPHQVPGKMNELQESFLGQPVQAPRAPGASETGRKTPTKIPPNSGPRTAGDLIQFPGQPDQEPDKQAQIEFYNFCAQLIKQIKDLYENPKYDSLSVEEKDRLWEKAGHFIWTSGIDFTP